MKIREKREKSFELAVRNRKKWLGNNLKNTRAVAEGKRKNYLNGQKVLLTASTFSSGKIVKNWVQFVQLYEFDKEWASGRYAVSSEGL